MRDVSRARASNNVTKNVTLTFKSLLQVAWRIWFSIPPQTCHAWQGGYGKLRLCHPSHTLRTPSTYQHRRWRWLWLRWQGEDFSLDRCGYHSWTTKEGWWRCYWARWRGFPSTIQERLAWLVLYLQATFRCDTPNAPDAILQAALANWNILPSLRQLTSMKAQNSRVIVRFPGFTHRLCQTARLSEREPDRVRNRGYTNQTWHLVLNVTRAKPGGLGWLWVEGDCRRTHRLRLW